MLINEINSKILFRETKYLIQSRYLGSKLGKFWILLSPVILTVIYTLVMTVVFKMKMGNESTEMDYAVYLLIGMAAFNATNDGIVSSANSIIANANLIKNMVFPVEMLPISAYLSSSITLIVSLSLAIILMIIFGRYPGWEIIFLPFWVALHYFSLLGICLYLASHCVFNRDILHILGPIFIMLMFTSPIFYVEEMVPEKFRMIWIFNPIYHILNGYRSLIMYSRLPEFTSTIFLMIIGFVFFVAGSWIFKRTKPYFEERL